MTFDELPLLCAVHAAELGSHERTTQQSRLAMWQGVSFVYAELTGGGGFPWTVDQVVDMHLKWRKGVKNRTKAEVATLHGDTCFWVNRGKGPCCNEVELGHLVPDSKGGEVSVANCIIECRAHNNQRRAMLVEQYLLATQTTGE